MGLSVASDQNPKMLQADTEFAGIFNNLHVFCHCIREWLQRIQRSNFVGGINDRQCRDRQSGRADNLFPNLQLVVAETVFAIKPFDDLMHQFAWERHLIKGPALHSRMNLDCNGVGNTHRRVHQA